jgi:hypothetical protein
MLTQYHATITRKALREQVSPRALAAIVAANLGQDDFLTGQIGHDEYHFDNNAFTESRIFIENQRALIDASLRNGDFPAAWAAFGRLTHAAQDFYAHSTYVAMWLARFHSDGQKPPAPSEIDPLMNEFLTSPDLRSGKIYFPLEFLAYIPLLKPLVTRLLPRDSHAWMNIDSPERGERFAYAFEAAVKRTRSEFDTTVAGLLSGQEALFKDL